VGGVGGGKTGPEIVGGPHQAIQRLEYQGFTTTKEPNASNLCLKG
jgi:hypothetical protein